MHVRIRYCRPCRYRLRAEHLADVIRREFAADVETEAGNFGVFKVWVDDELVFDKYRAHGWIGRFGFGAVPPDEIVLKSIRDHLDVKAAASAGAAT
jgi:selT/selW/selH-like putative selenoprotein